MIACIIDHGIGNLDKHETECRCGICDNNGRTCTASVIKIDSGEKKKIENKQLKLADVKTRHPVITFHASSYKESKNLAKDWCKKEGYQAIIVEGVVAITLLEQPKTLGFNYSVLNKSLLKEAKKGGY